MKTPQHKLKSYKKAQKRWMKKRPLYKKEYYEKNKEKIKAISRKWQKEHKERINELARKRRKLNPGQSKGAKKWQEEHPNYNKENREKVKLEVLNYYSNNQLKCNICGFNDIDCLAIDHINNDGSKDRKIHHTGYNIYCWLKRNKYPKGFQVLCCNCNWKKHKLIIKY